jgi:UDP-glucose 4-epimerase
VRALVTGGGGFIGSHLVDRLLADGYAVDVADDFSTGSVANLADAFATRRCHAVTADITSPGFADWVAMRRPDVVFHLAAQIDVRASVAEPVRDAHVNVLGTVNVLEAAHRADVRKVVNVSSVAIYGNPATLPVREDVTPVSPLSPYAASKLSAETYCHQYRQLHSLPTTTVVLTNVYGPRQRRGTSAVAIWSEAMLASQPTYLYGDGNVRDYLFVEDAVDAIVRAANPLVTAGRVTVGSGIAVTDRELHDAVAAAVGMQRDPEVRTRRHGDVTAMVVDPTEAKETLGWEPRIPLDAGIKATLAAIHAPAST